MSESESGRGARVSLECVVPILSVRDLRASLDYYVDVLGFRKEWGHDDGPHPFAGIARDDLAIYLCQGAQGQPGAWVWIGVSDVEALHEELRTRGARICEELTNYPWAREMRVADPDGNVLRFGSEPRESDQG